MLTDAAVIRLLLMAKPFNDMTEIGNLFDLGFWM